MTETEKFWSRVDKSGDCWLWTGRKNGYGYGRFANDLMAHRVSYSLANGSVPEGMHVLHHCDNRLCVNPQHLYAGTDKDNAHDKVQRGRCPKVNPKVRGEGNGSAKLTETQVKEILSLHKSGLSNVSISHKYGVYQANIARIVNGELWKHVTRSEEAL
jgi:hypothetical protein